MELEQLRQLEAVASCGTFSAAAERTHISQPALSRSMQRLEAELGASLFARTKNSVELNEAGLLALEHAQGILRDVARMREALDGLRARRSMLRVGTCAPAPLWRLMPAIAERRPDLVANPETMPVAELERRLLDGTLDFAIVPHRPEGEGVRSAVLMREDLCAFLPKGHPLAGRASLSLAELDGETFLLYAGIGFWRDICEHLMPRAHYVTQSDYLVFGQLARTSPLPSFVTDESELKRADLDRVSIPLEDAAVHVTFYLAMRERPGYPLNDLMDWLERRFALTGNGPAPR